MSKEAKPDPAMERRIIERTTPRDVKVGRSNVPASTQKAVLLALATFAGCSIIRPSYEAIAERACCTPDTVRRALKALQIQGLIGKTARHWSGGGRRPNQYHFRFRAMAATNTQPDTHPEDMDAATDEYVEAVEGGWETPPALHGGGAAIQGGVPCNTGGGTLQYRVEDQGEDQGEDQDPPISPPRGGTPRMTIDDKFDEFWEAYPSFRRDARKRARDAFGKKHVRSVPHETLMAKVREFAAVANRAPPERRVFVPQITTWLNQGRWAGDRAAWEVSILGDRAGRTEVKW